MVSHYKELCHAIPSWIECRVVNSEQYIIINDRLSSHDVLTLLDDKFFVVPTTLRDRKDADALEVEELGELTKQNVNLQQRVL